MKRGKINREPSNMLLYLNTHMRVIINKEDYLHKTSEELVHVETVRDAY